MRASETKLQAGQARPVDTRVLEAEPQNAVINLAAEAATRAVRARFPEIDANELTDYHRLCLRAVVIKSLDPDARVKVRKIPAYLEGITCTFAGKINGTYVKVTLSGMTDEATSAKDVELTLRAHGIPVVPIPRAVEESIAFACKVEQVDGVDCVLSNEGNLSMEDVVRATLVKLVERDQEIMDTITGRRQYGYGEVDYMVPEYFLSTIRVSLA